MRILGSVVLGYVVMAALVFGLFTVAYLAMGTGRAFQPGTYDVSALWAITSLILSFVAAFVGGIVCAAVGKVPKAPQVLAAVVLILGVVFAVPALRAPYETKERAADVGNLQAMQQAQQPKWVTVVTPLVGVAGVLAGGRRRGKTPA